MNKVKELHYSFYVKKSQKAIEETNSYKSVGLCHRLIKKTIPVSILPTLKSIIVPAAPIKYKSMILLPHCPGETQALLVKYTAAIIPMLAGLNMCFVLILKMYFDDIAINPASIATSIESVFSNIDKPKDVTNALLTASNDLE